MASAHGWVSTSGFEWLIAVLIQRIEKKRRNRVLLAEFGRVLGAAAEGDLSQRIPSRVVGGTDDELADLSASVNSLLERLSVFAEEVIRVARDVGTEGRLGGRAQVPGVVGVWRDLTDSVNLMADNLTIQVRNIAQVATAVARGDLSQKITVDARGEILELKSTINTMVDQLTAFADEVTRVAHEVGTEGILGGQADVRGVSGTWQRLTDSVNSMAGNLTNQVRNIAQVTTAVAQGDLSKKITVGARGEILELKSTINTMVDQLTAFADEVTRVAHEVGTEGILGGQADVRGVSGTWQRLTDSVIDPGGKCVMLGGVANFGFAEVGANSVGQLLEPVEEGADRLFQLGAGFGGCAGGNGAFEVGIE